MRGEITAGENEADLLAVCHRCGSLLFRAGAVLRGRGSRKAGFNRENNQAS
jgi:hypothetical protein